MAKHADQVRNVNVNVDSEHNMVLEFTLRYLTKPMRPGTKGVDTYHATHLTSQQLAEIGKLAYAARSNDPDVLDRLCAEVIRVFVGVED